MVAYPTINSQGQWATCSPGRPGRDSTISPKLGDIKPAPSECVTLQNVSPTPLLKVIKSNKDGTHQVQLLLGD